jgi:hypothetical protein
VYNQDLCHRFPREGRSSNHMMKIRILAGLMLALALTAGGPDGAGVSSMPNAAARTQHVVDLFLAGKYREVYALFSPEMKKGLSLADYKAGGDQINSQGKPTSIGEPRVASLGGYTVVNVLLRWPANALDFRVSWSADGRIVGTWFLAPEAVDAGAGSQALAAQARQVLDLVLARKYKDVYAMFGPEMKKAMTLEAFKASSAQLESLGKLENIGEAKAGMIDTVSQVTIPVRWPAVPLTFMVAWNEAGQMIGLRFVP